MQHLDLSFSGVEVKVLDIGNTQVLKYKCLKTERFEVLYLSILTLYHWITGSNSSSSSSVDASSGGVCDHHGGAQQEGRPGQPVQPPHVPAAAGLPAAAAVLPGTGAALHR